MLAGASGADDAARRYAERLAAAFQGAPPRKVRTTELKEVDQASLIVVPQPAASTMLGVSGRVEQLLRSSRRPALFVPGM